MYKPNKTILLAMVLYALNHNPLPFDVNDLRAEQKTQIEAGQKTKFPVKTKGDLIPDNGIDEFVEATKNGNRIYVKIYWSEKKEKVLWDISYIGDFCKIWIDEFKGANRLFIGAKPNTDDGIAIVSYDKGKKEFKLEDMFSY